MKRPRSSTIQRSAAPKNRAAGHWPDWALALVLIALVVICYWPTIHAGFLMDDDHYVTKQPLVHSFDGLQKAWFQPSLVPQYYPVVYTVFWLEYQLWGPAPLGYHLVNVALHSAAVLLAWRLLTRLEVPGAWLAAAIFAVHPACVESVAWVTKLMNVLSLLLALGSMWCYLKFEPIVASDRPRGRSGRAWGHYVTSLALYVVALLTKTVVAPLPMVLLVVYWWKRGSLRWRDVAPLCAFFAIGTGMGLMSIWFERHHAGALGETWSLGFPERCLVAGRAIWFYAEKIVWPYPVMFFYPRWAIDTSAWWQYLFPIAVLVTLVVLWWQRDRLGRGPLAAAVIYCIVLFPAIGFFNVYAFLYSFVADHYQYHAMLAPIALVAAGIVLLGAWLEVRGRRVVYAATTLAVAILAGLSICQAELYSDSAATYRHVIASNPDCWIAYLNLASRLADDQKLEEAVELLKPAVQRFADNAPLHANLGGALIGVGANHGFSGDQLHEAIDQLEHSLRLDSKVALTHVNLGRALLYAGRPDAAVESFAAALELDAANVAGMYGMGCALSNEMKWPQAQKYFEQALRIDPTLADAHYGLANALAAQKEYRDAVTHYRETLRLKPNQFEALQNLGAILIELQEADAAIDSLERAVAIRPGDAMAQDNLQKARHLKQKQQQATKP